MYTVTLEGPTTSITATTKDRNLFKKFVLWLDHLGLLGKKIEIGKYHVNDKQVSFCTEKAEKVGLLIVE